MGAAIIGGIIGGVLDHHQVAADAATMPRPPPAQLLVPRSRQFWRRQPVYSRNVRRCENVGGQAAYYEVTLQPRSRDHYIQMSYPPARTIWSTGWVSRVSSPAPATKKGPAPVARGPFWFLMHCSAAKISP